METTYTLPPAATGAGRKAAELTVSNPPAETIVAANDDPDTGSRYKAAGALTRARLSLPVTLISSAG